MKDGIWKVERARICPACQMDMLPDYVMRCRGEMKKAICERCGKETHTMIWQYTMKGKAKERIGRLDG